MKNIFIVLCLVIVGCGEDREDTGSSGRNCSDQQFVGHWTVGDSLNDLFIKNDCTGHTPRCNAEFEIEVTSKPTDSGATGTAKLKITKTDGGNDCTPAGTYNCAFGFGTQWNSEAFYWNCGGNTMTYYRYQ